MFTVQQHFDEAITYVPDFLTNLELAQQWIEAGSQGPRPFFTVTLLPLSGADYNKLVGQSYRKIKRNMNFIEGAEKTVARVVKQYVPEVSGLAFARRDGSVAKPTDGGELYHECSIGYPALGDMIEDIVEALKDISKADAGDLKKLQLRFGGSTPPTTRSQPPEDGDALDAIPTSNRTQTSPTMSSSSAPATVMAKGQD